MTKFSLLIAESYHGDGKCQNVSTDKYTTTWSDDISALTNPKGMWRTERDAGSTIMYHGSPLSRAYVGFYEPPIQCKAAMHGSAKGRRMILHVPGRGYRYWYNYFSPHACRVQQSLVPQSFIWKSVFGMSGRCRKGLDSASFNKWAGPGENPAGRGTIGACGVMTAVPPIFLGLSSHSRHQQEINKLVSCFIRRWQIQHRVQHQQSSTLPNKVLHRCWWFDLERCGRHSPTNY